MTEATTATDAPAAPAAATPPAGAAPVTTPASTDAPAANGLPQDARDRELEQARKDAAGYRERLKQYEDRDKSEQQKATERIQELEAENAKLAAANRSDRAALAVTSAATAKGFRDPTIVHAIVQGGIEFDDKGNPKNIDKLVDDLAKAQPYMVNGATSDFGQGPRGQTPGAAIDMNALIRQRAGR